MTRLIAVTLTFLIAGIGLSCQMQTEAKNSTEVLMVIDTTKVSAVQLPYPSGGTLSVEEAGQRQDEIFEMQLSTKYFDWENPTSGGALHINQYDEIEVYQFTAGFIYSGKGVDSNGDSAVYVERATADTSIVIQREEITHYVGGIGFGTPASVLVTSEYDLKKSKSIELILEELFKLGTEIYYLKKN